MRLVVLKSGDFASWAEANGGALPYRFDLLASPGVDLVFTDRHRRGVFARPAAARLVAALERRAVPFVQTLMLLPRLRSADAVVAMFESESHFLAALRWLRVPGTRRATFVVVTCWLTALLETATPRKLAWYRRLYRSVDRVVVLSSMQVEPTMRGLDLPAERVRFVPFGVDHVAFSPGAATEGDYVLAAGRDRSRDWPTLFAAARRTGLPFKVLARAGEVEGLDVPPNVELLGYRPFEEYRDLLLGARVVVVAVSPRAYPTGQTVLLEAMAAAKATVVTATPGLGDYLRDGNAVTVPVADPEVLAAAIDELYASAEQRQAVGAAGRRFVEETANAESMWRDVMASLPASHGS